MCRSSSRKHIAVVLAVATLTLAACAPVSAQTLTQKYNLGIRGKFTRDGMLIGVVDEGSPSDTAGLKRGDIILKMDGQLITNQDDYNSVLNSCGGSLVLIVYKAATKRVVRVNMTLEGKGNGLLAPYLLGVMGKFTENGMLIRIVAKGTPAAKIGLQPNDLILRINNQAVCNQADFFKVLDLSGGSVILVVKKASNGRTVRLETDLTTYTLGAIGEFTREGMVITVVAPGTPAAAIGLQRGNVIERIDNQLIRSEDDFNKAIKNSGGSVVLVVRAGQLGQRVRLSVDLMNNPLGAWCEPAKDGMRVTSVAPGLSAEAIGLERGDVILKIDDQKVRTRKALLKALRDSAGAPTLVVRKGSTGKVEKLDLDLTR
jgi:S1-C subfamily serine protease